MGKNRPPRKIRELLVQLQTRRSELELSARDDRKGLVERLQRLIACEPQSYDKFENEATELLQECSESDTYVENDCMSKSGHECDTSISDGLTELQPDAIVDEAWRSVCEIRTQMHKDLRSANPSLGVPGRWRNRQKTAGVKEEMQASKVLHGFKIVPKVSLSFDDAARTGRRHAVCPELVSNSAHKTCAPTLAMQKGGVIVWIRPFDLRIYDNPALLHASNLNAAVQLVFVWASDEDIAEGLSRISGSAASLWLHHALAALDANYQQWYGLRISFVRGETTSSALQRVVEETGATKIVTSKAFDNAGRLAEKAVEHCMQSKGVEFLTFNSFLLNDVDKIRIDMTSHRGHFGTLVPFLFACNSQPPPAKPSSAPSKLLRGEKDSVPSDVGLQGLDLCRFPLRRDGSVLDWGATIVKEWVITESGAYAALQSFLKERLSKYEAERHLADASAVARLSPYLRFGMLSCRTVYWEGMAANAKDVSTTFWRRLVWRDLAYWQLRLFPNMSEKPIRDHYIGQKWNTDTRSLHSWCEGRTGFPIVDAGMRELWATGWMTQNVRMVAAIFLVEYLNISWVEGARWFSHTLVDADPAINPMMWQNAGKSGLDQWNFTMHPAEFGRRMDPTGNYVRRWVPELASLPPRFIHCPWEAPERLQKHISPGVYPERTVMDLEAAALASRKAILDQRSRRRDRNDAGGYDTLILPIGSTIKHDEQRIRLFTKKEYRLPLKATKYDDERFDGGYQMEKRPPGDAQIILGDFIRANV